MTVTAAQRVVSSPYGDVLTKNGFFFQPVFATVLSVLSAKTT